MSAQKWYSTYLSTTPREFELNLFNINKNVNFDQKMYKSESMVPTHFEKHLFLYGVGTPSDLQLYSCLRVGNRIAFASPSHCMVDARLDPHIVLKILTNSSFRAYVEFSFLRHIPLTASTSSFMSFLWHVALPARTCSFVIFDLFRFPLAYTVFAHLLYFRFPLHFPLQHRAEHRNYTPTLPEFAKLTA